MPKVTVILTHQLDQNRKYLDLAVTGLLGQTFTDFECLIVSGAETPYDVPKWSIHWDRSLDTATKKIHWAIENSDSEYILLHSDDVFMSKDALGALVSAMDGAGACIMNPFSNSDCRSLYYTDVLITKDPRTLDDGMPATKRLIHDMDYQEVRGWESEIMNFPLGRSILVPVQTVSFYCTLIPRKVWSAVGQLDPALEYRHNDQDFCMRARMGGIQSVVNLAPFVFHFGSKTLNHLADEATRDRASEHFVKKYAATPPPNETL